MRAELFTDHGSGARSDRRGLAAARSHLHANDTLLVLNPSRGGSARPT